MLRPGVVAGRGMGVIPAASMTCRPLRPRARGRTGLARAWFAALAFGLLLVGGCAIAPPQLPDALPAAWQTPIREHAAAAPDPAGWWRAFADPELDRLVEAALADNLAIGEARARLAGARVLGEHATAGYWPQARAHTLSEPTPDSSASYFQMGFDALWELPLFGRGASQAYMAQADVSAAASLVQAARVSVVAEVVRNYIELRTAEQQLALLGEAEALAADALRLARTRERLKLVSYGEVQEAERAEAAARAALHEPRMAADAAARRLALLLGREAPDPGWHGGTLPAWAGPFGIDAVPADLLRTRPEIRQAESAVLKAAGEAGLAHAEQFPHIALAGSITYSSKMLGGTRLATADRIVMFGPVIDMPLFDWGVRQSVAEARRHQLAASVLAYRQAVLAGLAEAETALGALAGQDERCQALGEGVTAAARAADRARTLQRLGLADEGAVNAGDAALLRARLELLAGERERALALVALYKALGGAPLPVQGPR